MLMFDGDFSSRSSIVSGGCFLSSPFADTKTSTSSECLFLFANIWDASPSVAISEADVQQGGKMVDVIAGGSIDTGGVVVITVVTLQLGSIGYGRKYPL